jgi:ribonucleoside-diphosphate reductase alpha chain
MAMLFDAELSPPGVAEESPIGNKQGGIAQPVGSHSPGTVATTPLQIQGATASARRSVMQVRKRNGDLEKVDVNKIVRAIDRCTLGLEYIDPMRVATRTISGLYDGATTAELDELSIHTAAGMISEEPEYSLLAARLLANYIHKEVRGLGVATFSQSISMGAACGLIREETANFVQSNARKLDYAIIDSNDERFQYFGMKTVYDRYLLRHPQQRIVLETPQFFFMRVACGLSSNAAEAINFYNLISSLAYLPSSPTLFNSGTSHTQMSSCYLIDSPLDELDSIYDRYRQVAKLSKFAGGIGIAFSRVRSRGSLIRGTNGKSNGIVPFLKTLDASVAAVNQGGKRKGAACVYLEPWHPDIEEFLELRDNTGEESRRTHNINLANWICDEFMRRVEGDELWSLFDPDTVPELVDLWGERFDLAYRSAESRGLAVKTVNARELYGKMMRTLAQTGNGWMTFKDASNSKCNQTLLDENVVHLSNLCTEITEVTSNEETAVCNLGSVNLAQHIQYDNGVPFLDVEKLRSTVRTAVVFLDRVIDINFYPSVEAARSNPLWRPVGLGVMGLQDLFFALRLPFDSEGAGELSTVVAEEIYLTALETSCDLAEEFGSFPRYDQSRTSKGQLQLDLWKVGGSQPERWSLLRERIAKYGLRNSLLIAIAPTATIASIAGCYECIEPQVSNLYKRETLSGEFMQVNNALVQELKNLGLWSPEIRDEIKRANGSVQGIMELPEEVRTLFRTAWELPQRALIDLAARRGPFIDQSQSLNLFIETPTIGKLSSMYLYAWKAGLKSTYYLRSRPASRIAQATVSSGERQEPSEVSTIGSSTPSRKSTAVSQSGAGLDEFPLRSRANESKVHATESEIARSDRSSVATSPHDVSDHSMGSPSKAVYAYALVADITTSDWSGSSSTPDDEVIDLDAIYPVTISSHSSSNPRVIAKTYSEADAIACSLENPETCEACQ